MENPNFRLEGVVRERSELTDFEGPLSLILMLLSKNKIEIRDISISDILDQYLEYLDRMQSMDLEIASEFVQMAAHLLYIKTRTLLAGEEEVSELEVLMESLEKLKCSDVHSAVEQIVPELKKASELGLLYYAKNPEPLPKTGGEYEYRHEPVELLRALSAVFTRGVKMGGSEESFSNAIPKRIVYSVVDKSRQIISRLRSGSASLEELYARCGSRSEIVATFLSVLELCGMGGLLIEKREQGYILSLAGEDIEDMLERIIE